MDGWGKWKVATINVGTTDHGDTYEFEVAVKEGLGETRHRVTLRKADHERLSGGKANPETLVTESFRFLLEREPKESILRSFDLTVISRYLTNTSARSPGDCEQGDSYKLHSVVGSSVNQGSWLRGTAGHHHLKPLPPGTAFCLWSGQS
jgi:hypothetical protein